MFGYFENKATELWSVMAPEKSDGEKLFIFVEEGRQAEVEDYLVNRSLDPNLRNKAGNSLLHVASFHGRLAIATLLLKHGADINASGARMNSCLHFAAASGQLEVVKFFVEQGNLKASNKNSLGQTAYDTANGYGVKQYLMKLVLEEEARDGTAPAMLGISRDRSEDERRLRNLPPPPTMNGQAPHPPQPVPMASTQPLQQQQPLHANGTMAADLTGGEPTQVVSPPRTPPTGLSDPNFRGTSSVSRPIKEDGFTTTVGNPELAAKYGNHTTFRPSPTLQSSPPPAAQGPPKLSAQRNHSPFATRGRYVAYDAKNNTTAKQLPKKTGAIPQVKPPQFQGKINMFTPQTASSNAPAGPTGSSPAGQKQTSMKGLGAPKLGTGPIRPPHMVSKSPVSAEAYTQGSFE